MARILMRAGRDPLEECSAEMLQDESRIGGNTGNFVFARAAYRLLSVPDQEVVTSNGPLDPADAERINAEFDAVVLPFANAFRPGFMTALQHHTELIRRLTVPVTVLSIGANAEVHGSVQDLRPLDDTVKEFVGAVLDRSPSIGVRGEFTADYLRSLGFRDVEVIGCPWMFMWGDQLRVTKQAEHLTAESRVAINHSPIRPRMGRVIEAARQTYPRLTYVAQDWRSLDLLLWGIEGARRSRHVPDHTGHPLYRNGQMVQFTDPYAWIDFLRGCDYSFGTRIHGNIVALLAGTPATVLAHDSRTLELARYHAIPHRILQDQRGTVQAADLYREADFTEFHAGHPKRFRTYVDYVERSGLRHTFAPGEDRGAAFDQKVSRLRQYSEVRPVLGDPETALRRLAHLRQETRAQAESVQAVRAQVDDLVEQVTQLRESLAHSSGPDTRGAHRSSAVEHRIGRLVERGRSAWRASHDRQSA